MSELKRILVPLDGSHLAEAALPMAVMLAQKFDCQILLVRVLDGVLVPRVSSYYQYAASWMAKARAQARKDATIYLQGHQEELRQQGVKAEILVREASPAEEIIDIAATEEVDLIVMSTLGLGGVARWTIGNIADKVARHSPCPVMLIRPEPQAKPTAAVS